MSLRTVFLSSTSRDLKEYREVVYHAIEAMTMWQKIRSQFKWQHLERPGELDLLVLGDRNR